MSVITVSVLILSLLYVVCVIVIAVGASTGVELPVVCEFCSGEIFISVVVFNISTMSDARVDVDLPVKGRLSVNPSRLFLDIALLRSRLIRGGRGAGDDSGGKCSCARSRSPLRKAHNRRVYDFR